jgi:SAM-dependent methyltransferase
VSEEAQTERFPSGKILMDHAELSRIVNDISHRYMDAKTVGYFDCLEALDSLEFHVLDLIDQSYAGSEMGNVRDQAVQLHARLTSIAQATIDQLIQDIRTQEPDASALKQRFNQYAHSGADTLIGDAPDYDLFDDFLSHLFQVDYEPSETRRRTKEMFYLQPTPGRIILDMINALPFTEADCFYDLGSGLGHVPLLVSLLTDAHAVGIEYEPTYSHYARCSAQKLGLTDVEFRNIDAQDADLSDGTIFFMFTPFIGTILRRVLDRLCDLSKARRITLCTYGPCTPIIEQETWLSPIRRSKGEIYRLAIFSSAALT